MALPERFLRRRFYDRGFLFSQLGLENRLTARPREVILILLLLVAAALSIPMAVDPMRAWGSFVDFLKVVLIFIVMVNVLRTERRLRTLFMLSLLAGRVLTFRPFLIIRREDLLARG